MRWFGGVHARLLRIGEHAIPNTGKFSIPSFKASQFFFKLAYALNQSRIWRNNFFVAGRGQNSTP
jgi:hypothetical protein